jgi:uncharacterized protein (DUF3084 family)
MTSEEINRTIEFIINQWAEFSLGMQDLKKRNEEFSREMQQLKEQTARFELWAAEVVEIQSRRLDQNEERIRQNEAAIRLSEAAIRQNEAAIRQNEAQIRQNEAQIRQNEAQIRQNAEGLSKQDKRYEVELVEQRRVNDAILSRIDLIIDRLVPPKN